MTGDCFIASVILAIHYITYYQCAHYLRANGYGQYSVLHGKSYKLITRCLLFYTLFLLLLL